jgi:hypothetical protein
LPQFLQHLFGRSAVDPTQAAFFFHQRLAFTAS